MSSFVRLQRLARLVAALRRHVHVARIDDHREAARLDADLDGMEEELSLLADDMMVEVLSRPRRRFCHCGTEIPWESPHETCGANHCRATVREARKTLERYAKGERIQGKVLT